MNIEVNMYSEIPLYAQITQQMKKMITDGILMEGYSLPSIRALSQELGVSIITARRAYTELEKDGYVITIPAKGTFVARGHKERLRQIGVERLEIAAAQVADFALVLGVDKEELLGLIAEAYEKEKDNESSQMREKRWKSTKIHFSL